MSRICTDSSLYSRNDCMQFFRAGSCCNASQPTNWRSLRRRTAVFGPCTTKFAACFSRRNSCMQGSMVSCAFTAVVKFLALVRCECRIAQRFRLSVSTFGLEHNIYNWQKFFKWQMDDLYSAMADKYLQLPKVACILSNNERSKYRVSKPVDEALRPPQIRKLPKMNLDF